MNKIKEKVAIYEEPYAELSQNSKHMHLLVKLPDVNKRNITLTVSHNVVQIRGMKKQKDLSLTALPKVYYRSILLPSHARTDKLKIKFKNNILKIKIPLKKQNNQRK